MKKNTIYTIEEYIAQGFTKEEAPLVLRSDIIFNKLVDRGGEFKNERERAEYSELVKRLGI